MAGSGAGADRDLGGTLGVDLEPARHFGMTGGCTMLCANLTDTAATGDCSVKQVLHGPVAGLGFYC